MSKRSRVDVDEGAVKKRQRTHEPQASAPGPAARTPPKQVIDLISDEEEEPAPKSAIGVTHQQVKSPTETYTETPPSPGLDEFASPPTSYRQQIREKIRATPAKEQEDADDIIGMDLADFGVSSSKATVEVVEKDGNDLEASMTLVDEIYIPEELLVLIFDYMKEGHRFVCMRVCKQWYTILKHERYWNMPIDTFTFHATLVPPENFETNITRSDMGMYASNVLFEGATELPPPRPGNSFNGGYSFGDVKMRASQVPTNTERILVDSRTALKISDNEGKLLGRFSLESNSKYGYTSAPLENDFKDMMGFLDKYNFLSLVYTPYEAVVAYSWISSSELCRFRMVVNINARKFNDFVIQKENAEAASSFFSFITHSNYSHLRTMFSHGQLFGNSTSIPPMKVTMRRPPTNLLAENFRLHKYQAEAASWMKHIEDLVDKNTEFEYYDTMNFLKGGSEFYLDHANKKFILPSELDWKKIPSFKYKFKGGVLADEMGLGKTFTAVAASLMNRAPLPKSLKSSEKALFGSPPPTLLSTRATLIICPNHVPKQWEEEIQKVTSKEVKVLYVTTKPQHDKVTYESIMTADFVVCTKQFFINANHYFGLLKPPGAKVKNRDKERPEWLAEDLKKLNKEMEADEMSIRKQSTPMLEYFAWQRLLIDEGHEVIQNVDLVAVFKNLSTKYRWYITGTPFLHGTSFKSVMNFLSIESNDDRLFKEVQPDNPKVARGKPIDVNFHSLFRSTDHTDLIFTFAYSNLLRSFLTNLFWRHTKEGVSDSFVVPPPINESVLLDFTPIERALYDTHKRDQWALRHICMTPFASSGSYSGDFVSSVSRSMNLANTPQQLTPEQLLDQALQVARGLPPTLPPAPEEPKKIGLLNETLESMTKNFGELSTKAIADLSRARIDLADVSRRLDIRILALGGAAYDGNDEQVKRMQREKKEEKARVDRLTDLVQWYSECVDIWAKTKPMKVPKLLKDKFAEVDGAVDIVDSMDIDETSAQTREREELEALIFCHGTKMANLIFFLRKVFAENHENRVILFSQHNEFLKLMASFLAANNIESSFVQGNVMSKTKALREFKAAKSKVRVIMLGIDQSASGTNLIAASHVILLDPVYGSSMQAAAKEAQAIGRAYRQGQSKSVIVVRLAIRNTIEHEVLIRNHLVHAKIEQNAH